MAGHSGTPSCLLSLSSGTPDIIVNNLLCFCVTKFGKLTESKLKCILKDFYSAGEICDAKQQLLSDVADRQILDRVPWYGTSVSSAIDIDDIFDLLVLISGDTSTLPRHQLPTYVADNLESVPSIQLDGGDLAFLLAKMDKMEAIIVKLNDAVHTLLSTAAHNNSNLPHTTAGVPATAIAHRPPCPPITKDIKQVACTTQAADPRHGKPTGSTSQRDNETTTDDDDGFQVHESARHRKQRARSAAGKQSTGNNVTQKNPSSAATVQSGRKSSGQPILVGMQTATGSNVRSITAARIFKSVYYVGNVNRSVDETAMARFVARLGVRVVTCYEVTKPRMTRWQRAHNVIPDHRAFRICINRADNDKFMNEAKWPATLLFHAGSRNG